MSDTLLWELSRASGIIAWILLVAAVVGGALPKARLPRSSAARRVLVLFHPAVSIGAVALTALHVVTIALDGEARLDLASVLVPLAAERERVGVAWGVVGLWLLVAATLSGALRRRLPRRAWTTIHLAAYPCAWIAAMHAATTGTDMGSPLLRGIGVALVAAGSAVALVRSLHGQPSRPARTVPARASRP